MENMQSDPIQMYKTPTIIEYVVSVELSPVSKECAVCANCQHCQPEPTVNSGYLCEINGCEIDDPDTDQCSSYFKWR